MKNVFRLLTLGLLATILVLCVLPGLQIAQAAAVEIDYYDLGDTDNASVYGGYYYAQTFTASDTYVASKVRVKLSKTWVGTATPIYLSICEVDSAGAPDIDTTVSSVGTISSSSITSTAGGSWYDFELSGTLTNGFQYAVVLMNPAGDITNRINWRWNPADVYAGGSYYTSTDGGLIWTDAARDFMFSVWGEAITLVDYETYDAGDNATDTVETTNWLAQTFTTGTALHDIEFVQLKLQRSGSNPGPLNVYIVETSVSAPVWINAATAYASGTINGDTVDNVAAAWYYVPMSLEPSTYSSFRPDYSTLYAVIISCPSGGVADYIDWSCNDSNSFATGSGYTSANSGATWALLTSDFMFRITGNSTLRIVDTAVFTNYIEAGDMLFLIHYEAWWDNNYPEAKSTFYFMAENATAPVAKTSMNNWGYQVGSIYLSESQAGSITWKGTCTITLDPYVIGCDNATYSLVATDWIGDKPALIDKWVRDTAQLMDIYYDPDIDIYAETFGTSTYGTITLLPGQGLLTEAGGEMFASGIVGLEDIRPDVFYMIKHTINPIYATFTNAGEKQLVNTVGPQFMTVFNAWGGVLNMSGGTFAVVLMLALACGTAGIGMFVAQDVRGGIVGVVPIIIIGFAMGFWPLAILSIIVMSVILVLVFTKVLTL